MVLISEVLPPICHVLKRGNLGHQIPVCGETPCWPCQAPCWAAEKSLRIVVLQIFRVISIKGEFLGISSLLFLFCSFCVSSSNTCVFGSQQMFGTEGTLMLYHQSLQSHCATVPLCPASRDCQAERKGFHKSKAKESCLNCFMSSHCRRIEMHLH